MRRAALREAQPELQRGVTRGVLHKNACRAKSRDRCGEGACGLTNAQRNGGLSPSGITRTGIGCGFYCRFAGKADRHVCLHSMNMGETSPCVG